MQPILQFEVAYPEKLSRITTFFRFLLLIPHGFALLFLIVAANFVTGIAWWAILILGRNPRGLWGFQCKVLQWQANVMVYANYLRDEFPPFGAGGYEPVHFHLDYPERLARWKLFFKTFFIIPNVFVWFFVWIAAAFLSGLSWFIILITGKYPRGMFDFVTGAIRWQLRIMTYTALLTDAYPPFTMSSVPSPTALDTGTGAPAYLPS